MALEVVYGNKLKDRLNQLLTKTTPEKFKLKIVSQHIHNASINGSNFLEKITRLVKGQVEIIIIINRKVLVGDKKEQALVEQLEHLGVKIFPKKSIHAKIILLEGKNRNCLLVSSLNISDTAIHESKEAGIYVENEHINLINDTRTYIMSILGES